MNLISVFIKPVDFLYLTDVYFSKFFILVKIQKMIVKPFTFNKKHFNLFFLLFIQPFLDDFTFENFDNLILTTNSRLAFRRLYLVLLFIRTNQSIVVFSHLFLFTLIQCVLYLFFKINYNFIYFINMQNVSLF